MNETTNKRDNTLTLKSGDCISQFNDFDCFTIDCMRDGRITIQLFPRLNGVKVKQDYEETRKWLDRYCAENDIAITLKQENQ